MLWIMTRPEELREMAASQLHVPVEAAGVFAADVSILARAAGGAAASAAADALGVGDAPLADGVAAAAGMRMAQEAGARAEGLSGVMLVAVTQTHVALLEWKGNSAAGTTTGVVLARFARQSTRIEGSHMGATCKVSLTDAHRTAKISGGVGFLSSGKQGKRAVLAALGLD